MSEGERIELAVLVAVAAHEGQLRKGGERYVNHVIRVGRRAEAYFHEDYLATQAYIVGLLHDVVEDTDVTPGTLRALFGKSVRDDVLALSRLADETYAEFVQRTIDTGSDVALVVKLSDLHDNMTDPAKVIRGDRYARADRKIRRELERRGVTPPVFA